VGCSQRIVTLFLHFDVCPSKSFYVVKFGNSCAGEVVGNQSLANLLIPDLLTSQYVGVVNLLGIMTTTI
jgi:hypothetical protein